MPVRESGLKPTSDATTGARLKAAPAPNQTTIEP
jgi:hypothetical protein